MNMNGASAEPAATLPPVFTQHWDETNSRLVRAMVNAAPANIDVKYDALLANKRTIDNPEVMTVKPGETVLLRIIAASVASDFFINTGVLDAELLAVDGQPVQPVRGNYFQLAIAQRLDLRVTIPQSGGVFPIIAQGEGTTLQCGVVLATSGANFVSLSTNANMLTTPLDNTQESLLHASAPLAAKKIDRSLPAVLSGTMQGYQWFINGNQYPNRNTLDVKLGERVEIVLINNTPMGHPMHLHDGAFQVVEINGKPISGAQRDTIEVPPHATVKIAFDADNIGLWPLHCHIGYHADSGMMTLLKYDGADTQFWQPEQVKLEKLDL
jgi:FtsP/CotA-like multicopper oxidase with cupredoxin domain